MLHEGKSVNGISAWVMLVAVFCVILLLPHIATAQQDPEKAKKEREEREKALRNAKPPSIKIRIKPKPTTKSPPPSSPEQPEPSVPVNPPLPVPVQAPIDEPQPPGYGAVIIDISRLRIDPNDGNLHILVDKVEIPIPKSDTAASGTDVFDVELSLENVREGTHILEIEHPIMKGYSEKFTIAANKLRHLIIQETSIVCGRVKVQSEPEAKVFVDGELKATTDKHGEALLYLSFEKFHNIKVKKDGYVPKEETGFQADANETLFLAMPLQKQP